MAYTIGTDIGGTFTDCVVVDEDGVLTTGKAPTTPHDRSVGFFGAIENAASKLGLTLEGVLQDCDRLVHATTTATNAMVERRGARVGLLTTKGHGEAILIMRGGGRTKGLDVDHMLHIAATDKPEAIVPRSMIFEVTERVAADGREVVALREEDVLEAVREFEAREVEAVAISYLWGFMNPEHERRTRELVEDHMPGVFISCGHEIAPKLGEYARTMATVMNCYIGPLMGAYVDVIGERARSLGLDRPVLFAQSVGGALPVPTVRRRPLLTLDSGPVSGVVGSVFLGDRFGQPNIITTDMGGTTFDVSVITAGVPRRRDSTIVNQYEMYLPRLDVESIGAGGGSIAWIDRNSATMKVGPRSAGADPGPMCYGTDGDEPTVTDANVVLGVIDPDNFLGGRKTLDAAAAVRGIEALGHDLGMSADETAAGIVRIIDTAMAEKIRRMTVFRGEDPREYVLYAFGGAGPMHASGFARELRVQQVVVPLGNLASVLSAMGTVAGDVVHVVDRSLSMLAPLSIAEVDGVFGELEETALKLLAEEGFGVDAISLDRRAALKYGAQAFDVEVDAGELSSGEELVDRFECAYAGRFGQDSGYANAGIELTNVRVHARGLLPRPALRPSAYESAGEPVANRGIYWPQSGARLESSVWRAVPAVGVEVHGPAVIELPDTTLPVPPGMRAYADDSGNLVLAAVDEVQDSLIRDSQLRPELAR